MKRKRLRVEDEPGPTRRSQSSRGRVQHSPYVDVSATQLPTTETQKVDFNQFNDGQLVELLRMVGVDAAAVDRISLIHQCKTYHELSEYHYPCEAHQVYPD